MKPRLLFLAFALIVIFAKTASAQAPQTGLWIGTVRLDKVTEPSGTLAPTAKVFEFRIIFHVDAGGNPRLLKDVIVVQNDHDFDPATPPQVRLITDLNFGFLNSASIVRRNGKAAAIRYGTSAYHFPEPEKPAPGVFAAGKGVSFNLDSGENDPLNPFRHKFHPDHARGLAYLRRVAISFEGASVADAPGYGVKRLRGTYKEAIENLTNKQIEMSGSLILDRISTVATLN
ncbi:MAG: hypothetical protein V4710_18510 [Verrucomicrobiota bacterium]